MLKLIDNNLILWDKRSEDGEIIFGKQQRDLGICVSNFQKKITREFK
jgi:hypothetical protein